MDIEDVEAADLPAWAPAALSHDCARYCRLIQEANPFMVCYLTRPT